jgi:DNA segregation ATPase FtsK/SpoIIIE, S-DNA-T family
VSWWRSSVRPDGRTGRRSYARRRARVGRSVQADVFGEPATRPARPDDPVMVLLHWAWRWRNELAPFYVVLGLAIVAGIGNDYAPHWWPLALPLGGAVTAAAWHWKANRHSERAYVLAVGASSTLWTTAAWWASPGHDWLFWSALAGAVGAGIPRWWHFRRRGKIAVRRGAPRGARRELRRIVKNWPELSADMDLAGSHVQRAEADAIGYTFTLALRAGLTAADVAGKVTHIESVLETRTGAARVTSVPSKANRALLRIVNNDPLAAPIPWPGTNATSINDPIVLGRFEDGDPVALSLVGEHVLTAGTMGRGKSGVLNAFMAELSSRRDVVLWGIDMKRGLELSPWRPVLDKLATTEDAAHELLSAANRVLDARADLLADRKERKWRPTPTEPALVIAVDELAELDADAMALVERLARMGRAEGIILIAVTQRPSADVLGGLDARTQMTARIALGVVEPRDGELILGTGRLSMGWRPDRLTGPGYFLVLVPGQHEQPRPARAHWLTDEAVGVAAGRHGADRPKLDRTSADAAEEPSEPSHAQRESASEPPTVTAAEADDALLALLATAPYAGLTVGDLAQRVGRKRTWVYDRLSAHARAGRAARVGPGRWRARATGGTS